jgi:uncharacterized membrane-anchored protein
MLLRRRRRSHLRTVLLGIAAMGVLLWAAVYRFNVPTELLWESLQLTLFVVGVIIGLAAVVATLWALGRRFLRRRR